MNFKFLSLIFAAIIYMLNPAFAANPTTTDNMMQSNPETLEWLIVLNKNEIAAANEILKKKPLNPQVKEFAQFMISQHTTLLNDTLKLSKRLQERPIHSKDATDLQAHGRKELADLKSLDAEDVQKPYINAMVKGHADALSTINKYIADEQNAPVKSLLETTKHHVAMHLEKAQKIQKELES